MNTCLGIIIIGTNGKISLIHWDGRAKESCLKKEIIWVEKISTIHIVENHNCKDKHTSIPKVISHYNCINKHNAKKGAVSVDSGGNLNLYPTLGNRSRVSTDLPNLIDIAVSPKVVHRRHAINMINNIINEYVSELGDLDMQFDGSDLKSPPELNEKSINFLVELNGKVSLMFDKESKKFKFFPGESTKNFETLPGQIESYLVTRKGFKGNQQKKVAAQTLGDYIYQLKMQDFTEYSYLSTSGNIATPPEDDYDGREKIGDFTSGDEEEDNDEDIQALNKRISKLSKGKAFDFGLLPPPREQEHTDFYADTLQSNEEEEEDEQQNTKLRSNNQHGSPS